MRLFVTFLMVTIALSLVRRAFSGLTRPTAQSRRRTPPDARPHAAQPQARPSPRLDPSIEDADFEELP